MIKWSRVQLVLSVITAAGLWQTALERFGFARPQRPGSAGDDERASAPLPTYSDLAGALHVHSTYSDGAGTVAEIAAAAAGAGVDFVLLCDHSSLEAIPNGEATWQEGGKVLIVVGTELTTSVGHLLVLDVPADFDVAYGQGAVQLQKQMAESGGYGFIALPLDLKDHWRDFSKRQPEVGIEVFNLSAIARTKISLPGFLLALQRYLSNEPMSAFSYIAGRPTRELRLWDKLMNQAHRARQPMPYAIGSLDSHALMKIGRKRYPFPTYEETFRVLRTHALTAERPGRTAETAADDTMRIHEALRHGRSYVSYDNYGDATGFSFLLRTDKECLAALGDKYSLTGSRAGKTSAPQAFFEVCSPSRRSIIRLLRNGRVIAKVRGPRLLCDLKKPGVYRVEVDNYRWRVGGICIGTHPWVFSNPIEVCSLSK